MTERVNRMLVVLRAWARTRLHNDSGQAVAEYLMIGAMGVVVIVALGALLQALGVEIIDFIREQLGLA